MSSYSNQKNLRHCLNAAITVGLVFLAGLIFHSSFRATPAYAMSPSCGSYTTWMNVTAMGDEYSYDHNNPTLSYIVGTSYIEANYVCPDYDFEVSATITGPDGYYTTDETYDSICARVDVYLPLSGAVGRYSLDNLNYRILNSTGSEEYIGCTHTYADAEEESDLYYYSTNSYEYKDANGITRKACLYDPCPSNQGKVCASSSGFADYRNVSDPCPKGIHDRVQRISQFLGIITKCKRISHDDLGDWFTCR